MTEKELFLMIGEADPILVALAEKATAKPKKLIIFQPAFISAAGSIAACLIVAFLINFQNSIGRLNSNLPINFTSDNTMNEFNYNGNRYYVSHVYSKEDFSENNLSDELGILKASNSETISDKNLETNSLDGGIIYKMNDFNPAFKLVVKYKDEFYVAQLLSKSDGTSINLKEYFDASSAKEKAVRTDIATKNAKKLNKKETEKLLDFIELSTPIIATNEVKEAFYNPSEDSDYISLFIELKDETTIVMTIIPDKQLLNIENNFYKLPENFLKEFEFK